MSFASPQPLRTAEFHDLVGHLSLHRPCGTALRSLGDLSGTTGLDCPHMRFQRPPRHAFPRPIPDPDRPPPHRAFQLLPRPDLRAGSRVGEILDFVNIGDRRETSANRRLVPRGDSKIPPNILSQ